DGGYAWNSGMFLFRASDYLDELASCEPEMAKLCRTAMERRAQDMDFIRPDGASFTAIRGTSIDYGVMEKTARAALVPVDMGWNDVGSWTGLLDISSRDADGNVATGDVILKDVSGSYIRSDGPLVAAMGLRDAVVVATGDAVLVTR